MPRSLDVRNDPTLQLCVLGQYVRHGIDQRAAARLLPERHAPIGQEQPASREVDSNRLQHVPRGGAFKDLIEFDLESCAWAGGLEPYDACAGGRPEGCSPGTQVRLFNLADTVDAGRGELFV
jgi:hypothetical protein